MYFLIVISGPLSLEDYIFVPSHVQQMTCCLKFLQHPMMMQKRESKKQGNLKLVEEKMWRRKELI